MSFPNKTIRKPHIRKFKNSPNSVLTNGMNIDINGKIVKLLKKPIPNSYVIVDFENIRLTLGKSLLFNIFLEEYYKKCTPIFVCNSKSFLRIKHYFSPLKYNYYIVIIENNPNIPELDDYILNILFSILSQKTIVSVHSYDHYESNFNLGENNFSSNFIVLHSTLHHFFDEISILKNTPFEYKLTYFDNNIKIKNSVYNAYNYFQIALETVNYCGEKNIIYLNLFNTEHIYINLNITENFIFAQIISDDITKKLVSNINISEFNNSLINNLKYRHALVN